MTLVKFLGQDEASVAEQLIKAASDKSAKSVQGNISAHKTVWLGKDGNEKRKLVVQAALWARRGVGHVVECPSCECKAIVMGDPIAAPVKTIAGDEIIVAQEHLPNKFECVACGMKITGLSQLSACDLGDTYKSTQVYDAAEYYSASEEAPEYEDDNNEPF